jgi:hypothetical protein
MDFVHLDDMSVMFQPARSRTRFTKNPSNGDD